ncbi:MAG: hypothetical protein M1833_000428 [Piccolia ochrophora]|nr:MAG: hypothetical protein M1833_000428 [Piccolia ochrophora]
MTVKSIVIVFLSTFAALVHGYQADWYSCWGTLPKLVAEAFDEVENIAQEAFISLASPDISPEVLTLKRALFRDTSHSALGAVYRRFSKIKRNTSWLRVYCSDAHLTRDNGHSPPGFPPRWYDRINNRLVTLPGFVVGDADEALHPCELKEVYAFLYEEVHLVLCRKSFFTYDTNARPSFNELPLHAVNSIDLLSPGINHDRPIDWFRPQSSLIIEQPLSKANPTPTLPHTASPYRTATVTVGGMTRPANDFQTCHLLALLRPDLAVRNVHSLALFAIGVYIRGYEWSTGVAKLLPLAPAHPPAPPPPPLPHVVHGVSGLVRYPRAAVRRTS